MFEQRRSNYAKLIEDKSVSIFHSGYLKQKSGDQSFPFSVNRNFFYLTNIEQEDVYLVIVKGNNVSESFLFIEKVDPIKALWDGATLDFEEASKLSNIELKNIRDINNLDTFINQILGVSRGAIFGRLDNFYFDIEKQKPSEFLSNIEVTANKYKTNYPAVNVLNSNYYLAKLRMVKDQHEINETIKAVDITKTALEHVLTKLQPGIHEYEIEAEYNYILNKHNTTTSFDTIAASGVNATVLHYVDNDSLINDNELILFDLGVKYNNYCSDVSRTYPANGKFTARQKEIYEIVLKSNKDTIQWLKPGITIKEFNDYGKQVLIDGLKKAGLIKEDNEITKYYYHSLGHYLGLDVHDVGLYDVVIPEGALITVEPGLYIAEESIGIRIEDNIIVRAKGNINLTKEIIKEVKDIEEFMKNK